MIPPITRTFPGFCDRCDRPYLSAQFPNHGLCGPCYGAQVATNNPRSRIA